MNLKDEKVIGYILLAVGVTMIFLSVYFMFSVFTGSTAPPMLFNLPDIFITIPGIGNVLLIPGGEISKMVAMSFWYLLMFFIMVAGGKVASLGVSLVREIKVELKKEKD
ncbi:MAG: hypothetical protein HXX80_06710 [Nitrososphaerales archaeon]|nr:hypothetical protein [Nitrososphaerales archaeon]